MCGICEQNQRIAAVLIQSFCHGQRSPHEVADQPLGIICHHHECVSFRPHLRWRAPEVLPEAAAIALATTLGVLIVALSPLVAIAVAADPITERMLVVEAIVVVQLCLLCLAPPITFPFWHVCGGHSDCTRLRPRGRCGCNCGGRRSERCKCGRRGCGRGDCGCCRGGYSRSGRGCRRVLGAGSGGHQDLLHHHLQIRCIESSWSQVRTCFRRGIRR
mmetsp:Transcript_67534/g.170416  ORF Transcript_67534/g.170416 Transcript_67534/m.170416 type:complete len:217 (-) Transcript_67534:413-1063(-)